MMTADEFGALAWWFLSLTLLAGIVADLWTRSRRSRLWWFYLVAAIVLGLVKPAAAAGDRTVITRDGKNLGEIRKDRAGGGYSIYDKESKRIGDGKPTPDGRSIEFYDPKGKRLFNIRKDR